MLAYSGAKAPSRFYLGDVVTRAEDREIRSVSGRRPDYSGELACMHGIQTPLDTKMADNSSLGSVGLPRWQAN